MKLITFFLFSLVTIHSSFAQANEQQAADGSASATKPNIIFILTDDQGYGDLARHGHPLLRTPHTDRLHDESVRFDNFYVSPSCAPTRAALMTGMHEFRNGVTHTRDPREHLWKDATLCPNYSKLRAIRPATSASGTSAGMMNTTRTSAALTGPCREPTTLTPNSSLYKDDNKPKHVKGKGFREDLYFDHAMSFIKQAGDQPFFLYLCTYSPHTPLLGPGEIHRALPWQGR